MQALQGDTTDRALLARLGDWADHRAWTEFVRRYDPMIRRACRSYRLDPETVEELSQRIWIELADRMKGYRCDPGGKFRGWLGRLCRSRAIDLLRQRRAEALRRGVLSPPEELPEGAWMAAEDDEPSPADAMPLLRRAREVQEAVRRRVDDRTWRIFWSIAVEDGSVREAAEDAGLSYAAAFAAQKRVRRMLREENDRLGAEG